MNQRNERVIILKRIDYSEADRILTVLTPHGKKSLLAKGVRKQKSKQAGGLELFSTSDVVYIDGRSELKTVVSSRLHQHFRELTANYQRTMIGYDFNKLLLNYIEHESDEDYFFLLETAYTALNNTDLDERLTQAWFLMKLLDVRGNGIQLRHTARGVELEEDVRYDFLFEDMAFSASKSGTFGRDEIVFLRLIRDAKNPESLRRIRAWEEHIDTVLIVLSQTHKYSH